nr:hypothetical protein [Tanacetum cinerariifolium]
MSGTIPPPLGSSSGHSGNPNRAVTSSRTVGNPNRVEDVFKLTTLIARDSDSNFEEDTRSNNEFLADPNAEFHEKALLANHKSQKDYLGKYKALKAELALLTKKIDVVSNNKSEKGLVSESFDCDEESPSFEDKGVTRVKTFLAIAKDEPVMQKVDSRSGQWVEITMKKEPLPLLPIILGAEPICISNDVILLTDLIQTIIVIDKTKQVNEKESYVKAIKNKDQTKAPTIPDPCSNKKADSSIEQLLVTLREEVKGIKEQIKPSSDNSASVSQTGSFKSIKGKKD